MIVEDSEDIRGLLQNYLEKYGYQTVVAADFTAVLDVFCEKSLMWCCLISTCRPMTAIIGAARSASTPQARSFSFQPETGKWIR